MKRRAISGSQSMLNKKVERDVRSVVSAIIKNGDGIIVWWSLGVDFIAIDEALAVDPKGKGIKIFLPTALDVYDNYLQKKVDEWCTTKKEANALIAQLKWLADGEFFTIIESIQDTQCNKRTCFKRNTKIVESADELIAFHINKSKWTQDAIDKALKLWKKVTEYEYTIPLK